MVLSVQSFFTSAGILMGGDSMGMGKGGGRLGDDAENGGGAASETEKLITPAAADSDGEKKGAGWMSWWMGSSSSSSSASPERREWMRLMYQYFRLVIFLLHAATSVWFLVVAFTTNCGASLVTVSFFESVAILDGSWGGYNFDNHGPPLPSMATLLAGGGLVSPEALLVGPDPPAYNVEFRDANESLYQSKCVFPLEASQNLVSWTGAGKASYYSENRSWYICRALDPGPPYMMDVQEDVRSFILGSAWNVLVLIVMFEWITSSYALVYLQEPAVLLQYLPAPPGFHPVPTLATVWNLGLLVIIWAARDKLLIPDNNLLLYSALLLATMVFQNYLARPGTPPMIINGGVVVLPEPVDAGVVAEGGDGEEEAGERISIKDARASGLWSGGGALLFKTDALAASSSSSSSLHQRKGRGAGGNRKLKSGNGKGLVLDTSAFLGGLTGGGSDAGVTMARPIYVRTPVLYGTPGAAAFHSPLYSYNLDVGGEAVAARMMEYSTTAPLLLVGLNLLFGGAALTWAFQVLFLALMVCNALGIVLHYVVLLMRTAMTKEDRAKLAMAGKIALIASWASFAAGFAIYLNEAWFFMIHGADSTGAPAWVVMLMWSLVLMYSAFGFVVTGFYVPRLMYPDPSTWKSGATADDRDPWLVTFDWVVVCLDILSVAAKLALAWTVYTKGSVVNCAVASDGLAC